MLHRRKLKIEQRQPNYKGERTKLSQKDSTSCFTSWICRVSHVKNPVIFHERGEDGMTTRNGTYQWLSMTQTFRNVTVNQVKKEAINLSRCNLNVPTRNPWFCSIFVSNWEIYTSAKYAGAAGMLLNLSN